MNRCLECREPDGAKGDLLWCAKANGFLHGTGECAGRWWIRHALSSDVSSRVSCKYMYAPSASADPCGSRDVTAVAVTDPLEIPSRKIWWDADVSDTATIGEGSIIGFEATVGANAKLWERVSWVKVSS